MSDFIFEGFDPSNTTQVPDVFFDRLMAFLSDAQLRIMLYIIRRTLGFKKTSDYISLNQFRYGIKTRGPDGEERQLDFGCGLKSMNAITKAAADLERMGCIEREKSKTKVGDDNTTRYRIRFRSAAQAPVVQGGTISSVVPPTIPGVVPPTIPGIGGSNPGVVPYYPGDSRGTTPGVVGVLSPEYSQLNSKTRYSKQDTVKQERDCWPQSTPASLILPYQDFLTLDNLERPTVLTVVLASKQDAEQYDTSITDDSRDIAASEVARELAHLGHPVAILRTRATDAIIVEADPAPAPTKKAARRRKQATADQVEASADQDGLAAQEPPKKAVTRKRATVEKPDLLAQASEGAKFVVGEWLAIFREPRPVTKYVIENAETIAAYNPEPGEVAACRGWQYANDTNGYFKRRGHDIGDVARDFGRFRSLKNAPAPAPQAQGGGQRSRRPAPAPAPQGDQADQDAAAAAALARLQQRKNTAIKPTGPVAPAGIR